MKFVCGVWSENIIEVHLLSHWKSTKSKCVLATYLEFFQILNNLMLACVIALAHYTASYK